MPTHRALRKKTTSAIPQSAPPAFNAQDTSPSAEVPVEPIVVPVNDEDTLVSHEVTLPVYEYLAVDESLRKHKQEIIKYEKAHNERMPSHRVALLQRADQADHERISQAKANRKVQPPSSIIKRPLKR